MGKSKIPILITSCVLIMILLTAYLLFHRDPTDSDNFIYTSRDKVEASAVSPGAITKLVDSSSNYTYIPPTYEYDDNNIDKKEEQMSNNIHIIDSWTPATEMDLDPQSITVFVNKEYCLPKDYVPENLVVPNITFETNTINERNHMRIEAAEAIEKLFAAASEDGLTLYGISGYRSYTRQKEIFLNNIVHRGKKHTLKYSAAPGTSEHQTGLAMDVSSKSIRYKLITSFAKCKEGKWLANHAHEFGFIIRYPKDQYDITGYAYEPWHIRFVGEDLANYLYVNDMTLDEYYKYEPSEGFDYNKEYADLINYKPPITPTPIPEEELVDQELLEDITGQVIDGIEGEDSEFDDLEGVNPEADDLEGVNPEADDLEGENPEADDLEGVNPVNDDLEGVNPENDDLEGENPEADDLEGVNPVNDDLEGANPVNDDLEDVNPVADELEGASPVNDDL